MNRSLALAGVALLSLATVLASCSSEPASSPPQPASAAAATAPAKVEKQRTVVTKVPVLVKETSFYPDGLVDEFILYKMDAANKSLVEKDSFDPAVTDPIERVVPEYKGPALAAESTFDSGGKLRSRREFAYDASGRLVSERILDAGGKPQSSSAYAYDSAGRKAEWKALDGAGAVKAVSSYAYVGKNLTAVAMKDSGGRLTGTIRLEYSGGNLVKRSYLGPDGALQKFEAYAYDGGRLASLENRRADGSLDSRVAYEYGPLGELTKAAEYGSSGSLKGYTTYEYVVREDSAVETYFE